MLLAALSQGHADLADWLFLAAFIICVVVFVLRLAGTALPPKLDWLALVLGLISLAWFVL